MDVTSVSILGFAAGTLTTAAFVPQVLKSARSRSCHDLSMGMLLIFTSGVALWVVYGIYLHAVPVIAANSVTLLLLLVLLALKLRYGIRS